MTARLSVYDWSVIVLYFAAVVFVGFRAARRAGNHIDEYLVAGRSLTLPVFVATLVSTWYGGILGVGEFSYRYGVATGSTPSRAVLLLRNSLRNIPGPARSQKQGCIQSRTN